METRRKQDFPVRKEAAPDVSSGVSPDILPSEYVERLRSNLSRLQTMLNRPLEKPADSTAVIDSVYALLHNTRGQAQDVGHDLVTRICSLACGILQRNKTPDGNVLRAVKAHIQALDIIFAHDLPRDGGALGQQLVTRLEDLAAVARG